MTVSIYSENWYRVDTLHPRLRTHVNVQRRVFRGGVWYVLRDATSGRHHRVSETAYHIVGRLSGMLSVQQIWETACAQLGDEAPTQDEVIELLSTLHEAHLIQSEMAPDVDELFQRRDGVARKKRMAAVNPMSFRVPLLDPTVFLNRWLGLVRPVYSAAGLVLWALIVGLCGVSLLPHWRELTAYGSHLLETRYLFLMVLCYPVIKTLHELGHAFAVRVWEGEVREMGVALMLLIPVPYVDASAASSFPERHRRVLVGAAGIMVEVLLASLAGFLWLSVEPGLVRDAAFTVMAIGGISTVLFNGNPLMRLDGYYILSDALEIPNLSARANAATLTLVQRRLLGIKTVKPFVADRFERLFLPVYCLLSLGYRMSISALVVLWIASKSLALAVLAGGWTLYAMVVLPVYRAVQYLMQAPALARYRTRAIGVSLGAFAACLVLLFVVPAPMSSRALGVFWFPEEAQIRAQTSGFVVRLQPEEEVARGTAIVELSNPVVAARLEASEARLQLAQVHLRQAMQDQPTELRSATQEVIAAQAEFDEAQRKHDGLRIVALTQGKLVLPHVSDLPGSFIKQGTTLGYVVTGDEPVVRVAVSQEQAGRIRDGVQSVEVRLAEEPLVARSARVLREIPAGDSRLHSAALGDRAGGDIRTDPTDPDGMKTLEPVFFFDLSVSELKAQRVGGRVHVRFDHGFEPLALQWGRALRQLFLRRVEIASA